MSSIIDNKFIFIINLIVQERIHLIKDKSTFHSLLLLNSEMLNICKKNLLFFLQNFKLKLHISFHPTIYQSNLESFSSSCYISLLSSDNDKQTSSTSTTISSFIMNEDNEFDIESQLENIGCEMKTEKLVIYEIYSSQHILEIITNKTISCKLTSDKLVINSLNEDILDETTAKDKYFEDYQSMNKNLKIPIFYEKFIKSDKDIIIMSSKKICSIYTKKMFHIYSHVDKHRSESSSEDLGDYDLDKFQSSEEDEESSYVDYEYYNTSEYNHNKREYYSSPPTIHHSKRFKL